MSGRSGIRRLALGLGLLPLVTLAAPAALADPPAHAPAHGRRAKHREPERRAPAPPERKRVEVVFDSERGVYVGVGLPDVFFHEGRYYRRSKEGGWQFSLTGDGDWSFSASGSVPDPVVKAGRQQPGPAAPGAPGRARK